MARIICLFIILFSLFVFESNSLYADDFDLALRWLNDNIEKERGVLIIDYDTMCRKVRKRINPTTEIEVIPSGGFKSICLFNWPGEIRFTRNISIAACSREYKCRETLRDEIRLLKQLSRKVRTIPFDTRIFKINCAKSESRNCYAFLIEWIPDSVSAKPPLVYESYTEDRDDPDNLINIINRIENERIKHRIIDDFRALREYWLTYYIQDFQVIVDIARGIVYGFDPQDILEQTRVGEEERVIEDTRNFDKFLKEIMR